MLAKLLLQLVPCRVVVLSLCKPLRRMAQTSTRLWEDVTQFLGKPEELHALGRWLSYRRQQLGRLSLAASRSTPWLTQELTLLLGKLAGSSLHSLRLVWNSPLVIGSWVADLPRLQLLEVRNQHWQVEAGLAEAVALTRLSFDSWGISIALRPGLLPPNLRSLHLGNLSTNPSALPPLPPLEHLSITFAAANASEGMLEQLSRLASLTHLSFCGLRSSSVPRHLTALTALAELHLPGGLQGSVLNAASDATWAPLLACTRLTFLKLSNCGLKALPASVLSLPRLEVG